MPNEPLPPPSAEDAAQQVAVRITQAPASTPAPQQSYAVKQLAEDLFAAVARPGGRATSNGFFVVGPHYVVAGGAHMTQGAITDLFAAIAAQTDKPVRYFILPHHHRGFTHIDFDFPPGTDIITSWQTRQQLEAEVRKPDFPIVFFSDGLTLKLGNQTVILTNMGRGHSEGDTLVYLPETQVLFTGDLVYAGSIGYMGEGYMEDWILALEFMDRLAPRTVIPGHGPVSPPEVIQHFKTYFKDFTTTVLEHINRGDSLEQTLATFSLPRHRDLQGYDQFLKANVERAYKNLKETLEQ